MKEVKASYTMLKMPYNSPVNADALDNAVYFKAKAGSSEIEYYTLTDLSSSIIGNLKI